MNNIATILNKQKHFLIFLFLLSFVIRFLFFEYFLKSGNPISTQDSQEYHDIAMQLVEGHGFDLSTNLIKGNGRVYLNFSNLSNTHVTNFFRLPGYPLFLAFCYKEFGLNPSFAIKFQIFLSSFLPLLIFYLTLVLFPANLFLAKACSVFSVFYLGFVLYSGLLLTEAIFLVFLLLFFIFFLGNFKLFFCGNVAFSKRQLFLSGIFLGFASLMRPVGLYLVVLSVFLLLFSSFGFWIKIKASVLLFMGWLLIVFWWLLRNFILTGYIFFHTLPGPHFLNYITSHMYMRFYNCDWHAASEKLTQEWSGQVMEIEKKVGKKLSEVECCIVAEKLAIKYWMQNPIMFLKFSLYNMYRTMFDLHSHVFFIDLKNYSSGWIFFLSFLNHIYFLILLGFFGFILFSFLNFGYFCCLSKVFPFIALFIFITLATGFSRMRLPIEPFLIILSMRFWIDLCRRKKSVI